MTKCKRCWKENPAEIHTCTTWFYFSKQEKIDAIYEEIANKELSFGCKVIITWNIENVISLTNWNTYTSYIDRHWMLNQRVIDIKDLDEIIWHPVLPWDVFDYQYKNSPHSNITEERLVILWLWKEKRLPIESQNDKCIDHIHNLLK